VEWGEAVSFLSWIGWKGTEEVPNANTPGVPPASVGMVDYTPGDPHGLEIIEAEPSNRGQTIFAASGWDGWPAEWDMPIFDLQSRFNELADIAWACLDLNARVLATMPVYKTKNGEIIEASTWMLNPDPTIYNSWQEMAKQLFRDYQLGEAFILPMSTGRDGYPLTFRVMPPWSIHVEMRGGVRRYRLGGETGPDVTDEILHIPYQISTDQAHGVGPLEVAGARMLTARMLAQYVRNVAATGGVVAQTLESDQAINDTTAQIIMDRWVDARVANMGAPPVLGAGLSLVDHMQMSPKDMAMLEISQFTESRICILLGVPPTMMGLPSGDSQTYANVQQVYDFHDRSALRPFASDVMAAMSSWALPRGTNVELNRDEYTRPAFEVRAAAWVQLVAAGMVSVDEYRAAERFAGEAPTLAVTALTGGEV
jgi:HK97 family phage portal protein